jgi:hypothetical protein
MKKPPVEPPPTFDELSDPEKVAVYGQVVDFLQRHGRPIPKPRAFRSLKSAMRAIVIDEGLSGPEGGE